MLEVLQCLSDYNEHIVISKSTADIEYTIIHFKTGYCASSYELNINVLFVAEYKKCDCICITTEET